MKPVSECVAFFLAVAFSAATAAASTTYRMPFGKVHNADKKVSFLATHFAMLCV